MQCNKDGAFPLEMEPAARLATTLLNVAKWYPLKISW